MITISFVRHGESTDNLRTVWAGWKDAPLSNHGMNQATACGESFSSIRITTIYASPLDRAHTTAKAIFNAQADPRPPFIVSPDLREQHFGKAEGEPLAFTGGMVQGKVYSIRDGRDAKFPEGESLNDLQLRASKALEELIMPWVYSDDCYGKGEGEIHLVVVGHGLCISELVSALVNKDADGYGQGRNYKGLVNTAWTRVTVGLKGEGAIPAPTTVDKMAPLVVRVTHINQHEHLAGIGGIGSMASDPKQKDIRDFFGGGKPN